MCADVLSLLLLQRDVDLVASTLFLFYVFVQMLAVPQRVVLRPGVSSERVGRPQEGVRRPRECVSGVSYFE